MRGIDLDVGTGELVAVIGANGAGKTTSLNGIAGALPVRAGSIVFDGEDITRLPVHERVRRGMSLVPEGRGIFARLTVAENLDMGAYLRRDAAGVRADIERGYALFPRLAERRRQLAGTLSSRCWRSRAPSWDGHGCCCSMSRAWDWRRWSRG